MNYNYYSGVTKTGVNKLAVFTVAFFFAIAILTAMLTPVGANSHEECEETGAGSLTANYINESPTGAFDVTCDIGIYVDEDMSVNNVQVNGTVEHSQEVQYGIYVDGADVEVKNSYVNVEVDYPHEFVSVTYRNGATGVLANSELTGAHRAAVVVRGEGTSLDIKGNLIAGSGAKTSGWAENGVQVDQGAAASIVNNTITGHWWDGESNWGSTAVMLYGVNDNQVVNNTFEDNEFSILVFGDNNKVKGNNTSSDVESGSSFEFQAWGVLLYGQNNHLSGNKLTADDGAAGIYIYSGSKKNKFTGNRIAGFEEAVVDNGSENMVRGLVTPVQ